jgi:hypothetical protein
VATFGSSNLLAVHLLNISRAALGVTPARLTSVTLQADTQASFSFTFTVGPVNIFGERTAQQLEALFLQVLTQGYFDLSLNGGITAAAGIGIGTSVILPPVEDKSTEWTTNDTVAAVVGAVIGVLTVLIIFAMLLLRHEESETKPAAPEIPPEPVVTRSAQPGPAAAAYNLNKTVVRFGDGSAAPFVQKFDSVPATASNPASRNSRAANFAIMTARVAVNDNYDDVYKIPAKSSAPPAPAAAPPFKPVSLRPASTRPVQDGVTSNTAAPSLASLLQAARSSLSSSSPRSSWAAPAGSNSSPRLSETSLESLRATTVTFNNRRDPRISESSVGFSAGAPTLAVAGRLSAGDNTFGFQNLASDSDSYDEVDAASELSARAGDYISVDPAEK